MYVEGAINFAFHHVRRLFRFKKKINKYIKFWALREMRYMYIYIDLCISGIKSSTTKPFIKKILINCKSQNVSI